MSLLEQIGLGVVITIIVFVTIMQIWMQYIKFKVAERVMSQNIADYETKYAALQAKYPNSYEQMNAFREMHHKFVTDRHAEDKAKRATEAAKKNKTR